MKKKSTIYDVSHRAGVSVATVSRVINTPEKVNAETRKLVEDIIRELDYRPLLQMRVRSMKDIPRICICSPHFTSQSFVQRLRGISKYFSLPENECDIQIFAVNSRAQLDRFIDTISMRGIDGVIFLSLTLTDAELAKVTDAGVECVTVEYESPAVSSITNDNYRGGQLAARALIERGYTDFGLVCEDYHWDYTVYTMKDRMDGYRAEIEANGFELPESAIYSSRIDSTSVRSQFNEVFRSGSYPRALFATADIIAYGVLMAAKDCDLRVPEDVAIIGFDDLDFSETMGLSTISQHLDESGELAARILYGKLRDPDRANQQIRLDLKAVERETT